MSCSILRLARLSKQRGGVEPVEGEGRIVSVGGLGGRCLMRGTVSWVQVTCSEICEIL
jgi:hypothetical protein